MKINLFSLDYGSVRTENCLVKIASHNLLCSNEEV